MRPTKLLRERVELNDGRAVTVRPIDPTDADALMELHDHLSYESQYFRFFGPKPHLTRREAEYLANVDFHKRFALVAEAQDPERLVAVGRFDVNEPGVAEAAIVVRDDHQGAGLGTALLRRMREVARGANLDSFTAEILAENAKMIDLLRGQGLEISAPSEGVVRVVAPITDAPVLFKGLKVVARFAGAVLPKGDRT